MSRRGICLTAWLAGCSFVVFALTLVGAFINASIEKTTIHPRFVDTTMLPPTANIASRRIVANDPAAGTNNRTALDILLRDSAATGVPVDLPVGTVYLDKALYIRPEHSGAWLRGAGSRRTILYNANTPSPYVDNCTLSLLGDTRALGYAETWSAADLTAGWIQFPRGWDMTLYAPGRALYLYGFNSYQPDQPSNNYRVRIRAISGTTITFDSPVTTGTGKLKDTNMSKYVDGYAVKDVPEGSLQASFVLPSDAGYYTSGAMVFLTSGASVANEAVGEYLMVRSVSVPTGTVTFDRPTRRAWNAATLVRIKTVSDVNVSDLTLAAPVNTAANALFLKFAYRVAFTNVRMTGRSANVSSSGFVNFVDSDDEAGIETNNCHDTLYRGGTIAGLYFEESCCDCDVRSLTVLKPGGLVHGVVINGTGCQRVRIRDVRIHGAGENFGGGAGGGISGGGPECEFSDIVISGSRPGSGIYMSGNGLLFSNVRSDIGIVLKSGLGMYADRILAPWLSLGWSDGSACSGTARGCTNTSIGSTGMSQGGKPLWTIVP